MSGKEIAYRRFFLFSVYLNFCVSKCQRFYLNGLEGVNIGNIKLILLLYADDMTIFSETEAGLQEELKDFEAYCNRSK